MTTLNLAQIPFLDENGRVSQPWLLYLLQQNTNAVTNTGGLPLTANNLIIGNGTNDIKALGSLGTTTTLLHGNASGPPSFSAVSLTADVTGVLPAANITTGLNTQVLFVDGTAVAGNAGMVFIKGTGSFTLSTNYAGPETLVVANTSASASAQAAMGFFVGAKGLQFVQNSTAGGGLGQIYTDGTGGLNIFTSAITSLTLGANSSVTDFVIDSTNHVVIGNSAGIVGGSGLTEKFQVAGTTGFTSAGALHRYSADAAGTQFNLYKSRGAAVGTETVVQNADALGRIVGYGYDSAAYLPAAQIAFSVDDSTVGLNKMGGKLQFLTTLAGGTTQYTRVTVDNTGTVTLGVAGTNKGILALAGNTSGSVTIQPAAAAGSVTYTLPSVDGSKSYGFITDGAGITSWQDVGGKNVVLYGADPTGAADSLTAINNAITAAGSGGHVYFPPGTYKITNAIRPTSNVKLYGAGYSSQISYAGTGGITVDWVNGGGSGTDYFMVLNAHGNNRSGTVDTNIEICHLRFTYTSGTVPHCILFMNTTGCSVHHCYSDGGLSDHCAFLKSKYYSVHDNYSNGNVNCAYDNWDGPSHGIIAANVAVVGAGGSGIFVNGISTNTTPTPTQNDGFNMVVADNTLVAGATNCVQGIYIAGLSVTSTVKYVSVIGNTIKSDGGNVFSRGIDVRQGDYVAVTGNTVVGACSLNGIEVTSDYNSITGNIVNGVTTATTYGIEVTGNNNMFSGNVLQGNWANFNDTGTGNQNTSNSQTLNTINIVHA